VVGTAESAEQALRDNSIDVMLLDHGLEGGAKDSLLAAAQSNGRNLSTVVMIADGSAREAARALDRGAAAVLDKPFSDEELRTAIDRAMRGGFRGNLQGLSIIDMLQVFHIGRRSLILTVGSDPATRIWFEQGEIVHAQKGDEVGAEVLTQIVETRTGAIDTLPFQEPERSIDRSFHSLLLDTLRTKDEIQRDSGQFEIVDGGEPQLELSDSDFSDDLIPEPEPSAPEVMPSPSFVYSAPTARPARALDPICQAITAEVPSAVATALIDLDSGALVGMFNQTGFSADFERFLALYTRSLFRGAEVTHIEETLRSQRGFGGSNEHYLEEVVLTSRHTHHLTKVIKDGRVAVMVVTPRRTNVQDSWRSIRALVRGLESNLP